MQKGAPRREVADGAEASEDESLKEIIDMCIATSGSELGWANGSKQEYIQVKTDDTSVFLESGYFFPSMAPKILTVC